MDNVKHSQRELDGFTLVELLIALVITVTITVPISGILLSASRQLQLAADEGAYNLQVIAFSKRVSNDFKNSTNAYLFSSSAPSSSSQFCAASSDYAWNLDQTSFKRPLFSVLIKELPPIPFAGNSMREDGVTWTEASDSLVVYDLRRVTNSDGSSFYEIWRRECANSALGRSQSEQRYLSLGGLLCLNSERTQFTGIAGRKVGNLCPNETNGSDALASSGLTGEAIFSCKGAGTNTCPIGESTTNIYRYGIELPVADCAPASLAVLANNLSCFGENSSLRNTTNPLSFLGRMIAP